MSSDDPTPWSLHHLGRRGAVGAGLPSESQVTRPKSPRAVTGQDTRGLNCRPNPHAVWRRGLRSQRSPRGNQVRSLLLGRGEAGPPQPVPTGSNHPLSSWDTLHRTLTISQFIGSPGQIPGTPVALQVTTALMLPQRHLGILCAAEKQTRTQQELSTRFAERPRPSAPLIGQFTMTRLCSS